MIFFPLGSPFKNLTKGGFVISPSDRLLTKQTAEKPYVLFEPHAAKTSQGGREAITLGKAIRRLGMMYH